MSKFKNIDRRQLEEDWINIKHLVRKITFILYYLLLKFLEIRN